MEGSDVRSQENKVYNHLSFGADTSELIFKSMIAYTVAADGK